MNQDKFFYIVGRKKRIIKIFGLRISLDEVENILKNMGYSTKCVILDDLLLINYTNIKINIEDIIQLILEILSYF